MPSPRRGPQVRIPPEPRYTGPVVPTAYDPDWQRVVNFTLDQIAWFQAQPEWQNFLQYVALSPTTATAGTPVAVVNAALQIAGKTVVTQPLPITNITPKPTL